MYDTRVQRELTIFKELLSDRKRQAARCNNVSETKYNQ